MKGAVGLSAILGWLLAFSAVRARWLKRFRPRALRVALALPACMLTMSLAFYGLGVAFLGFSGRWAEMFISTMALVGSLLAGWMWVSNDLFGDELDDEPTPNELIADSDAPIAASMAQLDERGDVEAGEPLS